MKINGHVIPVQSREQKDNTIADPKVINTEKINKDSSNDEKQLDKKVLDDAIDKLNKTSRIFNRGLHFRFHEGAQRWQVQVIDLDKEKVIQEIPATKILDVVAQVDELVGILVDERR